MGVADLVEILKLQYSSCLCSFSYESGGFLPLQEVFHEPPADLSDRTVIFLDCGNIDRMPVDWLQRRRRDPQRRPPSRQHPLRRRQPRRRRTPPAPPRSSSRSPPRSASS